MDLLVSLARSVDTLDPGITAFLDTFRDEHVPLRLSLAIAAAALILMVLLVGWGAVAWGRLAKLRRVVRSPADPAAFAQRFDAIDRTLSHSIVGPAWTEYRECLKREENRILYLRHPADYLGLDAVGSASFPARFFAAVHGYFVGIGLLLTFVGLVAALKFSAAGVASSDIAVAKQALNALLAAASFKFMTSIAGLGCSLFLSVAARSISFAVDGAVQGLAIDLERAMVPVFTETLAYDQLIVSRRQLAHLEQFNNGFAARLAGELEPRFQARLTAANAPLIAAIGEVRDELRATDHDAVPRALQGFVTDMRHDAGADLKQLTARLAEVGSAIGGMQQHIGKSGEAFADQMSLAAAQLLEAASALRNGLDGGVSSVGDRIEALAGALAQSEARFAAAAIEVAHGMATTVKGAGDDIALRVVEATRGLAATSDGLADRVGSMLGGLDQINASLAAQVHSMQQVVASLGGAKQALDASAVTWTQSAAPIVTSVDTSQRIAVELGQAADRIAAAQHDMADMAKAVSELSDKAASVWDNYRGRFEKVDDDLERVFARLGDGTRAFGNEVMEFVGKLDANLANGMQALSVGTEELREVAETLIGKAAAEKAA
jgi:ABC-type transporter Mla subunit MlaD